MSHPQNNATHCPQIKSPEAIASNLQDLQDSQQKQKTTKRPQTSIDDKEATTSKIRVKEEYIAKQELTQPLESTGIRFDHQSGQSVVKIKRPESPTAFEQKSSKPAVTRQELLVEERFAMRSIGTSTDPVIIINPKDLVEASINTDPIVIHDEEVDIDDSFSDKSENSEGSDEDNYSGLHDDYEPDDMDDFDNEEMEDSGRSEGTDYDNDDGADDLDGLDDDSVGYDDYNDGDEEEQEKDSDEESDFNYDDDYSPPPTEYSSFRSELSQQSSLFSHLTASEKSLLGKRKTTCLSETVSSIPVTSSDQQAKETGEREQRSDVTEPIQPNWRQSLSSSFEDIQKFLYPSSDEQKSSNVKCKYYRQLQCNLPGNIEALDKAFCVPSDTLQTVRQKVLTVISVLAKELAQRHSHFRFSVESRGSGYNETKVGRPDEFDFLCILPEFSECNPQPCAANIIDVPNGTIHNEDDDFSNYLQSCYQLAVASGNEKLLRYTQKLDDSRTLLDSAAIKSAFHTAIADTTDSLHLDGCKVLVNKENNYPTKICFQDLSYAICVDLTPCVRTVQKSSSAETSEKVMKLVPSSKGFWKVSNLPLIESLEEVDDEAGTKAFIRSSKIIRDMMLSLLFDSSLEQIPVEPKNIILPFVRGKRPRKLVFCKKTARMLIDWHHICERPPSFTDMTSYAIQSNALRMRRTEPKPTHCEALKTLFSDLQMKGTAEDKILFRLPEDVHEAQRIVSAFLVLRLETLSDSERESFTATVTPPCYNTSQNVPDDIIPIATSEDRKKMRTKKGAVDVSIYSISGADLHDALQQEPWLKDRSFHFLSDLEEAKLPAGDKEMEFVVVRNSRNWTTVDARTMVNELNDRSVSRISQKYSKKRQQGEGHSVTAEVEVRAILMKI